MTVRFASSSRQGFREGPEVRNDRQQTPVPLEGRAVLALETAALGIVLCRRVTLIPFWEECGR